MKNSYRPIRLGEDCNGVRIAVGFDPIDGKC